MYERHTSYGLTALFVGVGVIMLFGGLWMYKKFRDPPKAQGVRSFGVGPRGLLALAGILLMLGGGAAIGVGILFATFN